MVLGNILKVKDRSLIIKNLNNTSDLNKNILRGLSGCPIVINRSGTITKYSFFMFEKFENILVDCIFGKLIGALLAFFAIIPILKILVKFSQ